MTSPDILPLERYVSLVLRISSDYDVTSRLREAAAQLGARKTSRLNPLSQGDSNGTQSPKRTFHRRIERYLQRRKPVHQGIAENGEGCLFRRSSRRIRRALGANQRACSPYRGNL